MNEEVTEKDDKERKDTNKSFQAYSTGRSGRLSDDFVVIFESWPFSIFEHDFFIFHELLLVVIFRLHLL